MVRSKRLYLLINLGETAKSPLFILPLLEQFLHNDCLNRHCKEIMLHFLFELRQRNPDITPKVIKDGNKYYVTCCYWNDWGGLKRELVEITCHDGKIAEFNDVTNETLFEYDCGIRF